MKKQMAKSGAIIALTLGLIFSGNVSFAEPEAPAREWSPVPHAILDQLRGGFMTSSGISIALGIEKAIIIDGILHTVSQISIPGLDKLPNLAQSSLPAATGGQQIPPGMDILQSNNLTVIQNSLDQTTIKNMTIINAAVQNLDFYRQMNMTNTISEAMMGSVR